MGIHFFDVVEESYPDVMAISKDLNLKVVARGMAGEAHGDVPDIMEILTKPLRTVEGIEKRLQVVMDCCYHSDITMRLREILTDTLNKLNNHIKAIQHCSDRSPRPQSHHFSSLKKVPTVPCAPFPLHQEFPYSSFEIPLRYGCEEEFPLYF